MLPTEIIFVYREKQRKIVYAASSSLNIKKLVTMSFTVLLGSLNWFLETHLFVYKYFIWRVLALIVLVFKNYAEYKFLYVLRGIPFDVYVKILISVISINNDLPSYVLQLL